LSDREEKEKKTNVFFIIINFISVFLAVCIVIIPLALYVIVQMNNPVQPVNNEILLQEIDGISLEEDGTYLIEIRRGETSQSVGRRLERAGLIKNRHFWNILCRLEKEHVKTGAYKIEIPASQISILRVLISGRQILYKVTIPEGVTLKKTGNILEEAGICSAGDFINAARDPDILSHYRIPRSSKVIPSMEGYLFPDTYLFPKEYPANMAVRKMADNFFNKLEIISPSFRNLNEQELHKIVILASIIEREYRIRDEAPLMSGVFNNRLKINMALQSCATVEYIITEIQGKPHPRVLLFSDLEINNPFNTYMYPGLPPGPISAPGNTALRAAVYPETTNFLYFRLTDPASGRHYFSRTYDEHIGAGELLTKPSWP